MSGNTFDNSVVVFFDRDGTLNENYEDGPVYRVARFKLFPYAAQAVRVINDLNIKALLITNQGGINHPKRDFTWDEYRKIEQRMHLELEKQGKAHLDDVFLCHHADYEQCNCRKPNTGMLQSAQDKYAYTPSLSYIIGDSSADIIAGNRMGLNTILVTSGWQQYVEKELEALSHSPDIVVENVLLAAQYIERQVMEMQNG